jgi:hypothetical protein
MYERACRQASEKAAGAFISSKMVEDELITIGAEERR